MMWNVPQTEEGLQTVLEQVEQCRSNGDFAELGNGLLALSHLVKWVRSDTNREPFERSHELALEALEVFRRIGELRGQVRALVAATPFADRETRDSMLLEAEKIATGENDESLAATVVAARARALGVSDRPQAAMLHQQALETYRRTGNLQGQANCLFGLAVGLDAPEKQRDAAKEGAEIYRRLGRHADAARCAAVALMYAQECEPLVELEDLATQGLQDAQNSGDHSLEGTFYHQLALISAAKGKVEEADRYRRWAAEIESSDGLTPLERWEEAVETTKLMIAMAKQQGEKEAAKTFKEGLRQLKATKPSE